MPDFITLSCPSCGGKLKITQDIQRFACAHCGTEHLVRRGDGIVSLAPVLELVSKGVDFTASELAIVRLDKEIIETELQLEKAKVSFGELKSEGKQISNVVIIFIILIVIVGCLMAFSGELVTTIFGIVLAILIPIGTIYLYNRNIQELSEKEKNKQKEITEVETILTKLQNERKYHRDKLDVR